MKKAMAHESLSIEDKHTILNGHFPLEVTTHAVDYIQDAPPNMLKEGHTLVETSTGRMYLQHKGELVLISEPTPVTLNSNPLKGKGKSYGKHVENTWGAAYDVSRDLIGGRDWF